MYTIERQSIGRKNVHYRARVSQVQRMYTIERQYHRQKECTLQSDSTIGKKMYTIERQYHRQKESTLQSDSTISRKNVHYRATVPQVERMDTIERHLPLFGKRYHVNVRAWKERFTDDAQEWTSKLFPNNGRCTIGRNSVHYRATLQQVERMDTIERQYHRQKECTQQSESTIGRKNVHQRATVPQVERMYSIERQYHRQKEWTLQSDICRYFGKDNMSK